MQTGKVLLGVVAGAAVGAAIGILFAPQKGSELRKTIADKGGDALKTVKDKFSGLKDKVSTLAEKGEEILETVGLGEKEKSLDGKKEDAKKDSKGPGAEKSSPAH